MIILMLVVLLAAAAALPAAQTTPCSGYAVSGAGDASVDGCYRASRACSQPACYRQDGTNRLMYEDAEVWRIKQDHQARYKVLSYVATASSHDGPPRSAAGWRCADEPAPGYPRGFNGSACPGPTVTSQLPPPPPPGPGTMYPVPTEPADIAVDCAVRGSAHQFAQSLQPWRGAHLPVFDALELSTRCNQTPPEEPRSHRRFARPQLRLPAAAATGTQPEFHVDAAAGNDSGSGSTAAPFASIGRGVQACRTVIGGCSLYLSDAAPFVLQETLALDSSDSFLTVLPEPDAQSSPVITGAVALTSSWVAHNTSDGQNIWKTSIPAGFGRAAVYIGGRR